MAFCLYCQRKSRGFVRGSKDKRVRDGLLSLLPKEIEGLRSWQRAVPSTQLDPACEAMLKSLAERNSKK